ncbi:MAG: hypothetical protein ABW154_06855 [Dyella sp.]
MKRLHRALTVSHLAGSAADHRDRLDLRAGTPRAHRQAAGRVDPRPRAIEPLSTRAVPSSQPTAPPFHDYPITLRD